MNLRNKRITQSEDRKLADAKRKELQLIARVKELEALLTQDATTDTILLQWLEKSLIEGKVIEFHNNQFYLRRFADLNHRPAKTLRQAIEEDMYSPDSKNP